MRSLPTEKPPPPPRGPVTSTESQSFGLECEPSVSLCAPLVLVLTLEGVTGHCACLFQQTGHRLGSIRPSSRLPPPPMTLNSKMKGEGGRGEPSGPFCALQPLGLALRVLPFSQGLLISSPVLSDQLLLPLYHAFGLFSLHALGSQRSLAWECPPDL